MPTRSCSLQSPVPSSKRLDDYLACTNTIDWHAPEVLSLAHTIAADADSEWERAKRLYEWVRDTIPHSADARHETVTCRASEVLRHRTGICYAKAHLLAAMLRAEGIPAGFCYQLLRYDDTSDRMVVHGLNGVYLTDVRRWLRIDPRGNKPGVNAQMEPDREQLAFDPDPDLDEYTCDTIFAEPLPSVLACLGSCASVTELIASLPNTIETGPLAPG